MRKALSYNNNDKINCGIRANEKQRSY